MQNSVALGVCVQTVVAPKAGVENLARLELVARIRGTCPHTSWFEFVLNVGARGAGVGCAGGLAALQCFPALGVCGQSFGAHRGGPRNLMTFGFLALLRGLWSWSTIFRGVVSKLSWLLEL